jgi:O-antigen biosynthesis protein
VEQAQRPEIAAVGAKLLYPEGTIQHAGVVLGIQQRAAHAFAGSDPASSAARRQLQVVRNYSAVTAACLLIRRAVYEELHGFDEVRFRVAYNDVDLCLRALQLGYRNVYTPHAVLKHHECASRPRVDNPQEVAALQAHCFGQDADWTDPYYHPLLNHRTADFTVA